MKSKLLHTENGQRTFALVFDKGDEVKGKLLDFAAENAIAGAQFSAIGAFREATLGYFDRKTKEYKKIPVDEQVEVVSLLGNIAQKDGKPQLHAHVVVGKSDGIAFGGHLLKATVWPTLEVVLVESPKHLLRTLDDETGLALIDLAA
jgi:predicted DNA-binding protein with PD1-like motif